MAIQCNKCGRKLKLPSNSTATKVKCPCGEVLSTRATTPSTTSGKRIKVVCSSCQASLSVPIEAAGKQVKCKCGKLIRVGRAAGSPAPAALPPSPSMSPDYQDAGGELDFLSSVSLTSSAVVKGPAYLQPPDSSADDAQPAQKTDSLTGSLLAGAAGEFSSSAALAEKEKKRTRFLLICSSVFACIIVPPIIYVIYKAANATTEGYANWGDKVQSDVISMKMQTADEDNKTKDLSEITSKTSGEFPKQPTEGQEMVINQKPGLKTQGEVRLFLETKYPGWKIKSITFSNFLFRAAMTYQPSPITLPEEGVFALGDKDSAIERMQEVSTDDNEAVLDLFRNHGYFNCTLKMTQVARAPNEITLNCTVDELRESVPESQFPSMVETVKQLVGKSFTTTLNVDDTFIIGEEKTSESGEDESNIEIRATYSEDPTVALKKKLQEYMKSQLKPEDLLKKQ